MLFSFDKKERTSFKALYILPRCWFTCIKWGQNETIQWQEEQRNMFLRIRRLVQCYNNHHLQDQHCERENLMYFPDNRPSPVGVSYTGIGEYPGYFFFYGSLNKSAFSSRYFITSHYFSRHKISQIEKLGIHFTQCKIFSGYLIYY